MSDEHTPDEIPTKTFELNDDVVMVNNPTKMSIVGRALMSEMDIGDWKKMARRVLERGIHNPGLMEEVTTALLYASENEGLTILDKLVELQWLAHRKVMADVEARKQGKSLAKLKDFCRAGRDGECSWEGCPQIRDGEPKATGRHCPIDDLEDRED